ncbi:MAG: AtpZ/AtpI family protein [Flavobacteriales bacterium]|nr:AtpZ/AtpI family protein [Flavobacteriales bacterium]MBK9288630.1 AtpZ/AtpI family protein [Flavobacteriales bacterium]MBL0036377.1 AtpZ/AtpI family protein [Flavobacteriales bacterium]
MEPDSPKEEFKKVRKGYDNYLRFSGLGLQMAGVILAGVLGGRWLDGRIGWEFPALTLLGALLGITGAMLFLFKETGRKD